MIFCASQNLKTSVFRWVCSTSPGALCRISSSVAGLISGERTSATPRSVLQISDRHLRRYPILNVYVEPGIELVNARHCGASLGHRAISLHFVRCCIVDFFLTTVLACMMFQTQTQTQTHLFKQDCRKSITSPLTITPSSYFTKYVKT